jgi:hypothetical protein
LAKELQKIDKTIESVDVHYSFRNTVKKNGHAIKYMCKPYCEGDYKMIEDNNLKHFLAVEMKGFQHLRFWGSMANCKYEEEMMQEIISEIDQKEFESAAGERLIPLFIAPYDAKSWADKVDDLGNGLFRVRKKSDCQEYIDEQMKIQRNEGCSDE